MLLAKSWLLKGVCLVRVLGCAAQHERANENVEPEPLDPTMSSWILTGESATYTEESETGWYTFQASSSLGEQTFLQLVKEENELVAYLGQPWELPGRFIWNEALDAFVGGATVGTWNDSFGSQSTYVHTLRFAVREGPNLEPEGIMTFEGDESRLEGDAGESRAVEGTFTYRRDDLAPELRVSTTSVAPWQPITLKVSEGVLATDLRDALGVGFEATPDVGEGNVVASRATFSPEGWWSPEQLGELAVRSLPDIEGNTLHRADFSLSLDWPTDSATRENFVGRGDHDTCEGAEGCATATSVSVRLTSDQPFSKVALRYFYDGSLPARYAEQDADEGSQTNLERLQRDYKPSFSIAPQGQTPRGYGPFEDDTLAAWNTRTIELDAPTRQVIVSVGVRERFAFGFEPEAVVDPRLLVDWVGIEE